MNRHARYKTRTPAKAISILEQVNLGGVDQWILIRGQHPENPVMLVIHGGPGLTLMPYHHVNTGLEQYVTVVHWDQRGAGKSFTPGLPPESLTFDQLKADATSLMRYLCNRFEQKRIYLAGHSLGTTIGLRLAADHPQLVQAFLGIGQVANKARGEALSYQFALDQAKKHNDTKSLQQLEAIGPPPYNYKAMLIQRRIVQKYGGNLCYATDILPLVKIAMASPFYSWIDRLKYMQGVQFSLKHLWEQSYDINLFEQAAHIEVPVYFALGRHDAVAPSQLAAEYFESLSAPQGKQLVWFEQSSHWPQIEQPNTFEHLVVEKMLKETAFTR